MASTSTSSPACSMRGARMNTPGNGPPTRPSTSRSASNESRWRPYALRRTATSMSAERLLIGTAVDDVASEQDHPRAGAEHREAVGQQLGERRAHRRRVEQLAHRGGLAAGEDQRVERAELRGCAHLDRVDAERVEHLTMLAERSLQRQHADLHGWLATSDARSRVFMAWRPRGHRSISPAAIGELDVEGVDLLAAHRVAEARATPWPRWWRRRSGWWPRRSPWPSWAGRRS